MLQDIQWKILISILICSTTWTEFVKADNAVSSTNPRQCYSCEGINCQRTSRLNVTSTCMDVLDICVTIFEDFAVVAKGCYSDMPENYRRKCDVSHNPECFKCFGQLCNNKGREDFKCIECNDNAKCDKDASAMKPKQCPIPTAPNSYCYARKIGGSKTQRGCLVHLADQLKCLKETSCSMCLSNDGDGVACNSYNVDTTNGISQATDMVLSVSVCLTSLLVIVGGLLR